MVGEFDVWRTARLLIDQHGDRAEFRAAARVDELIENGEMVGRAAWLRVAAAIRELQRTARDDATFN